MKDDLDDFEEYLYFSGAGGAQKGGKGGCYIATCVYGSYDCPEVWTLRRFRDNILGRHFLGRCFIRCYYAVSPTLVKRFGTRKWFQSFWRGELNRLVKYLQAKGIENTPYRDLK